MTKATLDPPGHDRGRSTRRRRDRPEAFALKGRPWVGRQGTRDEKDRRAAFGGRGTRLRRVVQAEKKGLKLMFDPSTSDMRGIMKSILFAFYVDMSAY